MVKVVEKAGVTSDWLAWELDGNHRPSRENVSVAINQNIKDGQVISFDGAGDMIAFDGVAAVAGVCINGVKTGAEKGKGVILAHLSRVVAEKLVVDSGQLVNAIAGLKTLGITAVRSA